MTGVYFLMNSGLSALAESGLDDLLPVRGAKPLSGNAYKIPMLKAAVPEGWKQNSGWYVAEKRLGSDLSMAQVRIVPAVPATGTFSEALRAAWKRMSASIAACANRA